MYRGMIRSPAHARTELTTVERGERRREVSKERVGRGEEKERGAGWVRGMSERRERAGERSERTVPCTVSVASEGGGM